MAFEDLESVKIGSDIEEIRHRKEAYLRSRGWESTSSTVDCCWRWFKEIESRHYGCGTDDAFKIQDVVDRREYAGKYPEEFND